MPRRTHTCSKAVGGSWHNLGKLAALYTPSTLLPKSLTSQGLFMRSLAASQTNLSPVSALAFSEIPSVSFSYTHYPHGLLLRLNYLSNIIISGLGGEGKNT